jgi:hypothetical protein
LDHIRRPLLRQGSVHASEFTPIKELGTERVKLADNFVNNVDLVVEAVSSTSSELEASGTSMSTAAEETNAQAGTGYIASRLD